MFFKAPDILAILAVLSCVTAAKAGEKPAGSFDIAQSINQHVSPNDLSVRPALRPNIQPVPNATMRRTNPNSGSANIGTITRTPGTAVSPTTHHLTRAQVRQMQENLGLLGFDAGAADGVSGAKTRGAIKAYQRAMKLPVTGNLTPFHRRVLMEAAMIVRRGHSLSAGLEYAANNVRRSPPSTAMVGAMASVAMAQSSPAIPTRGFAGPGQFPPRKYRGYGILAFEATVTEFDRERHQMICQAYISAMRSTFSIGVPTEDQFVTIWPLDEDKLADVMNHASSEKLCDRAIANYGLDRAHDSLLAARKAGFVDDGIGPFLLGWLPAESYDRDDALILVLDMSHVETYQQAQALLSEWKLDIQSDPELLKSGFSLEILRRKIRRFTIKYGDGFLSLIN